MKKKEIIGILIATVVLGLWLFASNAIVASSIGSDVEKVLGDIEALSKDPVYYSMGTYTCMDDIFDSFVMDGLAFCETEFDNSEKTIGVAFVGEKDTYLFTGHDLILETNINELFADQQIQGFFHGFRFYISTVKLPLGDYWIELYCRENDQNYGMVNTNLILRKSGKGISIAPLVEHSTIEQETANLSIPTRVSRDVISSTSQNEKQDSGSVIIAGVAYVNGRETRGQKVWVQLVYPDGTAAYFETTPMERADVAEQLHSKLYNASGYVVRIPANLIHSYDYTINCVVREEGNWHVSEHWVSP